MPAQFDVMLDAVIAAFPAGYSYLSPDGMVDLRGKTGAMLRGVIPLETDAENSGGIAQARSVLRVRTADFPGGTEPEQGAMVVIDGERSMITDVQTDPRGWSDLPLAAAPE
ncbi:head-tail joining protein [Muricoccus aerilatus]|uniref:head-tail joining protein n=1 Tax=Muricoccus aerilatus TaxID=452982 RepID=UPI0005C150F2|nr:hypothetical protein [Roseomonas aerilata]